MDNYRALDERNLELLKAKLAAFKAAAQKFIDKVDNGQARSVETYRELKAAMAMKEMA